MSRELVTPEGYRGDGRTIGELRKINIEFHPVRGVDGSCIFNIGNTRVLATVSGPNDDLRQRSPTESLLNVEYEVCPYAYGVRRMPQSSAPIAGQQNNASCRELALLIQKIFSNVILLHKWPGTGLKINVTVLCDQGSVLSASINAVTCALIIAGVDMNDVVTATTCGLYEKKPLLDVTQSEANALGGCTTLAIFNTKPTKNKSDDGAITMTTSGSIVEEQKRFDTSKKIAAVHHTQRLHLDQVPIAIDSCVAACTIVHTIIKDKIREFIHDTLEQ